MLMLCPLSIYLLKDNSFFDSTILSSLYMCVFTHTIAHLHLQLNRLQLLLFPLLLLFILNYIIINQLQTLGLL